MESRHVFTLVAFMANMLALCGRDSLRIAVISMKNEYLECMNFNLMQQNETTENNTYCGDIKWSESEIANILSGYSIGLMLTGAASGFVADAFSCKKIMLFTGLVGSLCTMILPETAHNLYLLVGSQILSGMAGGFVCPVLASMLTRWEPVSERGKLSTIIYSGSCASAILTSLLNGFVNKYNWRLTFYGFGIFQLLWLIPWYFLVFDHPRKHPRISLTEKRLLCEETHLSNGKVKIKDIPFSKLFSNRGIWAILISNMGFHWGVTHISLLLPQYLDFIGVSVEANGIMNSLPPLGMLVMGILASRIFSFIHRSYLSLTASRKLASTISFIGFGCFNLIIPVVSQLFLLDPSDHSLLVTAFSTIAFSLLGFHFVGGWTCAMDVAPDFAGTIMGISSCIDFFIAALVPYTVSAYSCVLPKHQVWLAVFVTTSIISGICCTVFLLAGTAQLQISLERLDAESPNLSEKESLKSELSDDIDIPIIEDLHFTKAELLTGVKRLHS